MRGEIVVVRAWGGVPLVRRVWETGNKIVYITDDEQLRRYEQGLPMLIPIGFPIEDVFRLQRNAILGDKVTWETMEPWSREA